MKYTRFLKEGKQYFGIIKENMVEVVEGDIFSNFNVTGEKVSLEGLCLLSPCTPSKIIALGLNYKDHAQEMDLSIPESPMLFLKPSTCITNPEDAIIKPDICKRLDYEGELGIVIGKKAKNISANQTDEYILGATCFNDVTARDLQPKTGQWTLAKSFDTFGPMGPCIVSGLDYNNLDIQLRLNGEIKQKSNTSNFIFKIEDIVSYVSKVMTLLPGDIIITGTPSGVGEMKREDIVEVEIEGIGILNNYVK